MAEYRWVCTDCHTGYNEWPHVCDLRLHERARIAAWLRDPMRYREACNGGPLVSESALRWLADRIEKGDHGSGVPGSSDVARIERAQQQVSKAESAHKAALVQWLSAGTRAARDVLADARTDLEQAHQRLRNLREGAQ